MSDWDDYGVTPPTRRALTILAACCVLWLVLGVLMYSCGLAPWLAPLTWAARAIGLAPW